MELSLSKTELKTLVELALMSDWLMTANDTEEDPRKSEYLALIQKIYRLAHDNGMDKEIVEDEELGELLPDADWEDESQAMVFLEEFEDLSFWSELVDKLADRDMKKELKGKKPESFDEQLKVYQKHADIFAEEFDANGLSRLEINAAKK